MTPPAPATAAVEAATPTVDQTTGEEAVPARREPSIPTDVVGFMSRYFPGGMVYLNGRFWSYGHGHWRQLEERPDVRRRVAEYLAPNDKSSAINNLMGLLRDCQSRRDSDCAPDLRKICLNNGTLDTETGTLIPHSNAYWLKTRLDIDWNNEATCPRWLRFLDEIFANDPDKDTKIAFVQEWFGYCLTPDTSQEKFVWMIGAGGNGKSVLLRVLTELLGLDNVSHAHLERIDRACVRAELQHKLVNISHEMSKNATVACAYWKALTSGEPIEAERKYQDSFIFTPYVRFIGATNELPRLADSSDGFFRRAVILTFNRQFSEADRDPQLVTTLLRELPGILTWAMAGLARLRSRGRFETPPSSVEALAEYRRDGDPLKLFADECLEPVQGRGMLARDVYAEYKRWCRDHGYSPVADNALGKRLVQLGYASTRSGGRTYRSVALSRSDEVGPTAAQSPPDPALCGVTMQ